MSKKTKQFSIRFSEEFYEKLVTEAKEKEMDVTKLVREILQLYFRENEQKEREQMALLKRTSKNLELLNDKMEERFDELKQQNNKQIKTLTALIEYLKDS